MLTGDLVEQRLEEERLASEAKKREREEQHLFLTAKASSGWVKCKTLQLTSIPRSSLMNPSNNIKDLIWRRLRRRTGRLRSFPPSAC